MCEIMCEMGNPDQWKDGYTDRVQIEHDIEAGVLYVCEDSEQYGIDPRSGPELYHDLSGRVEGFRPLLRDPSVRSAHPATRCRIVYAPMGLQACTD